MYINYFIKEGIGHLRHQTFEKCVSKLLSVRSHRPHPLWWFPRKKSRNSGSTFSSDQSETTFSFVYDFKRSCFESSDLTFEKDIPCPVSFVQGLPGPFLSLEPYTDTFFTTPWFTSRPSWRSVPVTEFFLWHSRSRVRPPRLVLPRRSVVHVSWYPLPPVRCSILLVVRSSLILRGRRSKKGERNPNP